MQKYVYNIVSIDGVDYVKEKYPVIIFNGRHLPLGAISIDYCASGNIFKNIDNSLSKWFWKFTICVGVNCSEQSDIVISNCGRLLKMLIDKERYVKTIIKEKHSFDDEENYFEWWVDALKIMIESAKKTNICKWTGIMPVPSEPSE